MGKKTYDPFAATNGNLELYKYSSIIFQLADPVVITDFDGVIEYVNPAFERLTGFSSHEAIGKKHEILKSGLHNVEFYKKLWDTILEGKVFQGTFINRKKNRELFFETKTITPILDGSGKIVNFVSTGKDITESKKVEAALLESEERFRTLFEAGNAVMLMIDPDSGEIVNANPAAAKFYGYAPDQLTTMNIAQINQLPPEEVEAERQRAKAEERNYFVFPHKLANGEVRIVEVHSQPIKTKSNILLFSIIQDVTERERLGEIARRREQDLQFLYEVSQRLVRTLDPNEIYRVVLEFISSVASTDILVISKYDNETQLISCRAYWIDDQWMDVRSFPSIPLEEEGKGTQSVVIRSGHSMLIEDFQAQVRSAQVNHYVDGKAGEIVEELPENADVPRSAMIVPLKIQDVVIGVIQVMCGRLNAYTEDQLKLLEALSLHIASAEKNAELFAQVQAELSERTRAEERMRILNRTYGVLSGVNKIILRVRDPQQLFDEACKIAVEQGGFLMVWIGMLDQQTKQVKPVASAGDTFNYLERINIFLDDSERGHGPTALALRSGEYVVVNDVASDPRVSVWREDALGYGYRAAAAFPIMVRGEVRCSLSLYASQLDFFNEDEVKQLSDMAADIAFALDYIEQEKERKFAEEALRRRNEEYRLISDNTGDVIWVLDLDAQTFTYVSPSIQKLRGLTPQEALKESLGDSLTPDSMARIQIILPVRLEAFLRNPKLSTYTDQVDQYRKDRSIVNVEVTTTFVINAAGKIQVVGISHDITERKQSELLQETVYRIADAAQNTESLQDLYPQIHEQIARVMPAENFYIASYDEVKNLLGFVYSVDEKDPYVPTPFPPGRGFTEYVLRTGMSLLCDDEKKKELVAQNECVPNGTACKIWLGVPLIAHGKTIGAMVVQHYSNPLAFGEREQHILEFVSSQVATAIERKKIEENIQLMEKRNRAIIENAPDGIVLLDIEGRFVYISPSTQAIFGYTDKEMLGQSSLKLVHPEDIPLIIQMKIDINRDPSRLCTIQYRYLHKDGTYRWIESTYKNLFDEPGVAALVVNFRDITENKLAGELIRKNQAGLEMAQAIAHLGSWELDPVNGTGLSWSKEMFRLFRRDPALGVPGLDEFMELVHPQERQLLLEAQRLSIEICEPVNVEYSAAFATEESRCYRATISPVFTPNGELQQISGTVLDITEQKRSEQNLRESERRLRQAQQIAHVGSWELDLQKNESTWSDEVYRIYELDPLNFKPNFENFLDIIHPADREMVGQTYADSLKTREPYEVIHRLLTKDGRLKYVQEKCETYYDNNGIPLRSIGTTLDITERLQMELDIRERVKELTCLFEVSRFLDDDSVSTDVQCQKIIKSLVPSMQFPELVISAIELGGKRYSTDYETEISSNYLSANITVKSVPFGKVFVYYTSDAAFLQEEQQLINNIAGMFGLWLERKQSDRLLRESTERINQIVNNIQEVFWMYDFTEQRIIYISPAYAHVWGRTCESLYQNPREYVMSILPEDQPIMFAALEKQAKGELTDMEYRIQRPDGGTRWIWDRSFPVYDENGTLIRNAGVATDITSEKDIQRELEALNRELEQRVEERTAEVRQSEMTYRALFENSNDGIFLLSPDGIDIAANKQALDMVGYTWEEYHALTQAEVNIITVPEQRADGANRLAAALRGELVPLYERTLVRKNGQRVDVEINLSPVRDTTGKIVMVQSVVRDITERKRVEESLRESEDKFKYIFEKSNSGKSLTKLSGEIHVNKAFCDMLGYSLEELQSGKWQDITHPDDIGLTQREVNRLVSGEADSIRFLKRFVHKNGAVIWVDLSSSIRRDKDGGSLYLISSVIDITERIRAEEALRNSNEQLSGANTALEKASRLKDEFLASMSHELRTPLTGILGLSEALQMQTYGALTEKQLKSVKTIESSGRHLLDLINDILDLSKVEAGKLDMKFGPCSVSNICQLSLQLVKGMSHQKEINISFSMNPSPMTIRADMRRLKQILVNLLSNAVKFTPQGGRVGLEIVGRSEENKIYLTVWDSGIGIKPEEFEKLFKPFTQLDSSLSRQYSGTGLGLSLVQRLAELHGGTVNVESTPGEGSRFTVILPWSAEIAHPSVQGSRQDEINSLKRSLILDDNEPGQNSNPTVLFVDDNETVLELVSDFLKTLGYRVVTARSGFELLEKASSLHPDIMLVDIQMPGIDGLETMRRVRAHSDPLIASTPMIALTALAMSGDREKVLQAGANEYMSKPISLPVLAGQIQEILKK